MSFRQTLHRVFSLDLRALGAFRVGLGLLLLMDGVYRGLDLEAFYTDHGIAPRDSALRSLGGGWSPLVETGDLWPAWLCLSVLLGGSLLLISGRLWRVGVVACWLSLQTFNIRNGLVLQVADAIHVLLLGWAFVLPLGERFVVGRRSSGANQVLSVATAGFFAQVIWIYMAAGIYKAAEPHWTQGALLIEAAFIDPVATSWLEFLLNAPLVLEIATRITPWMEIFGPLALLIPFRLARIRLALVATFVGFHLFGIGLMLRLALVPLTLALCWIPFLPSALWDRIWEEGGGGVSARSTL